VRVSKCIWVYELCERGAMPWARCPGCGAPSPGPGNLWVPQTLPHSLDVFYKSVCCGVFNYPRPANGGLIAFRERRG
jgi:hypothetical protein